MSQQDRERGDVTDHIPPATVAALRDREADLRALAAETDDPVIADGVELLVAVAHDEVPSPDVIQRLATHRDETGDAFEQVHAVGQSAASLTPQRTRSVVRRVVVALDG